MKTILIVSSADSSWTKEYVSRLLDEKEYKIGIVSIRNNTFSAFYREKSVTVIEIGRFKNNGLIKTIEKSLLLYREVRERIGKIDYIHFHYVASVLMFWCLPLIKKSKAKLILSFWGSDLLAVSSSEKKKYIPFLRKASKITVVSQEMYELFKREYKGKYLNKLSVVDFGIALFDVIDSIESISKSEMKKKWNIPLDKKSVHVGYNIHRYQQPMKILDEIVKLKDEIRENLYLIFHFAYGEPEPELENEIRTFLSDKDIQYRIVKGFLQGEELASFRMTADMMVYAQVTDALSGSVLEYLYAGCKLVEPAWLDYSLLQNNGVKMYQYGSFVELADIFTAAYKDDDISSTQKERTKYFLRKINGWNECIKKWKTLYDDRISGNATENINE